MRKNNHDEAHTLFRKRALNPTHKIEKHDKKEKVEQEGGQLDSKKTVVSCCGSQNWQLEKQLESQVEIKTSQREKILSNESDAKSC